MAFSFTTIEPNQIGQVTKFDIPVNQWLGLKFSEGYANTFGDAISRRTEDAIWDDEAKVRPDVLNRTFGIEGQLTFDRPTSIQRARLLHERKRKELERLSYLESASHSWFSAKAVAGFGASLIGGLSHPVDLGTAFLPFIGSEKAAASVAKLGGSAWRQSLARGIITEEALAARGVPFHRLTAAVIDGTVNQAVIEIPVAIQKYRDQAIYTPAESLFNIAAGGAFAGALKGLGLALERAGRLWAEADPRVREAVLQDTIRATMTGETPRAHWAMGMDEAAIRDLVEEKVRLENPLEVEAKAPETLGFKKTEQSGVFHVFEDEHGKMEVDFSGENVIKIGGIAIKPEFQGKGFGTEFLNRVKEIADATNRAVTLTAHANTPELQAKLNAFYEQSGFTKVSEDPLSKKPIYAYRPPPDAPAMEAQRNQSASEYFAKSKAEHEAKIKGLVDEETARTIAEVKRQMPPADAETLKNHTYPRVPEDSHIAAVEKEATDMEQGILARAKTPEDRIRLETELKAIEKELKENPRSAEKAVDEMTPCVVNKAKS